MIPKSILAFLLLYICATTCNHVPLKNDSLTEFIILHNNDMHARFEQTNRNGGACTQSDASRNKCFGGFARVAHE